MRIHPFWAIRAPAHRASEVSCPPYDVVTPSEARELAEAKPNSFMRVIRAEVDLDPKQNPYTEAVYDQARKNLDRLLSSGHLVREPEPAMFVYRQSKGGRRQAGLVCCLDIDGYRTGAIRRHELTRPDKEADRVRHIRALRAQAEAVMLAVPSVPAIEKQFARDMNDRPLLHFAAKDGVTHTLWRANNPDAYESIFASVERVYIADGHHRSAAAEIVAGELGATGGHGPQRLLSVVYPAEGLHILPYHRLVRLMGEESVESVMARLRELGPLAPMALADVTTTSGAGSVAIFASGSWWRFTLPTPTTGGALEQLDVTRLGQCVFAPVFGISDERTDPRLSFAGGCDAAQLEALVRAGHADLAFAMHPTSMSELLAIADAQLIMPPKSTWFDPKIRSGIFLHEFAAASAG